MEIFVAGATGAIGQRLVPRLVAAGHHVVATTRSPAKAGLLRSLGAEPAIMDGLDPVAVGEAVGRAQPEVVIHQMTQITLSDNLRRFDRDFAVTNRLRSEGTDNLIAAATAAGARRFIAASYAGWPAIRTGTPVKTEDDPFDPSPPAGQSASLAAIRHLENAVTTATAVEGIVLRYGSFYGPGTGNEFFGLARQHKVPLIGDGTGVWSFLHIDDAAVATVAALNHGRRGIYNITDNEPAKVADWLPFLAETVGGKPPLRVPVWAARLVAGEVAVSMMTKIRGASNARARAELGWSPAYPSYREGFPAAVASGAGQAEAAGTGAGKASDGRH
jgi:nucleoside-diphosphate-sugar epimerase